MNAGIFPPSSQCGAPPRSIGGAPARPVQMPCGIDGALDWKRPNWPAIQDSLYASLRASNWGYGSRATAATISAVTDNYVGTALARNGLVWATPFSATGGLVFDPVNNRTSVLGSFGGSLQFTSCVLMNDGRIFVIPRASSTARIVDLENRIVTTPSPTFPGGNAYVGGCLIDDGRRIYLAPGVRSTAGIYDIQRDALVTPAGTFSFDSGTSTAAASAAVLLPDGRVFIAPFWNTAAIYDPVTDTLKHSSLSLGSSNYFGAVLLPGGDELMLLRQNATANVIYNWRRDTSRTVAAGMPAVGQLAPNGTVLLVQRGGSSPYTARVYSPSSETVTTLSETFSVSAPCAGIHALPDGRMVVMPRSDSGVYTYGAKGPAFDPNVQLSPFYNHR